MLDLGTELYVMMYLLMFIAGWIPLRKANKINIIPSGNPVARLVNALGITGCLTTMVVGFFPPSNINTGSEWHFISLFAIGLCMLAAPGIIIMVLKSKKAIGIYDTGTQYEFA